MMSWTEELEQQVAADVGQGRALNLKLAGVIVFSMAVAGLGLWALGRTS